MRALNLTFIRLFTVLAALSLASVSAHAADELSSFDFGDAPDPPYDTLAAVGAAHIVHPDGFSLGDTVDADPDGQPDPNALGDDYDGEDDEDGVVFTSPLIPGQAASVDVTVRIPPGSSARLEAWVDFDGNGNWYGLGERILNTSLSPGLNSLNFPVPGYAVSGIATYARFRLSTGGVGSPDGIAGYGEVEDYEVRIGPNGPMPPVEMDFGDAPDPTYRTLLAHNGARHVRRGAWLGDASDMPDAEQDGQQDSQALGDDNDGNDDEDGVLVPPLVRGRSVLITVEVNGGGGYLHGWIDFNADGVWQGSERFYSGFVTGGLSSIFVGVPDDAVIGQTFGRFRISSLRTLSAYGPAPDGEVEDHEVQIVALPPDTRWAQLPDLTRHGMDIRVDDLRVIADDFECRCATLLTDVHLWGSWKDDIKGEITNIHLGIYRDDPAGPNGADPDNTFSKPDPEVLWAMNFGPGDFSESLYYTMPRFGEWWWDPATGELVQAGDTEVWRIDIDIDPDDAYLLRGLPHRPVVYWLEVRVDTKLGRFGWKTRQWRSHFNDDAVWDAGSELPRMFSELRYPPGHPLSLLVEDSIDMAFVLTGHRSPTSACCLPDGTCVDVSVADCLSIGGTPQCPGSDCTIVDCGCRWNPGDPNKMHWPQVPDVNETGIDVDMFWAPLADDFLCTETGPIADIHFWGSFAGDMLPEAGPASLSFKLTIYSNIPADNNASWSRPGEPLWTRIFHPCQYTVQIVPDSDTQGWYDPVTGLYSQEDHVRVFQYNFCIDEEPFVQEEGTVYWLEVQDLPRDNFRDYTFGWKTTTLDLRWNDDAVWLSENTPDPEWLPLTYPQPHEWASKSLDLAFVITGEGHCPAPPNDDCYNATAVGDVEELPFSTKCATFDGPGHYVRGPNIWFCYTATCTGRAIVSLCDSWYDTKLAVYDGCDCYPAIGDLIDFNDDYCGWESQVTIDVTAGHQYLIEIGGYAGETGDGLLTIVCQAPPDGVDFGDAPDPKYPTLYENNGAGHIIVLNVRLGNRIDPDPDGQPDATATGDDGDESDDEDGVVFTSPLMPDDAATVRVVASIPGFLNAWLDFNSDGDWSDDGEQIFYNKPVNGGINDLSFNVPASAALGYTFARFRYSTVTGLAWDDLAPDGEVEDYRVHIGEQPYQPKPPTMHVKWSQPPIEWHPASGAPVYCGWDEVSVGLSHSEAGDGPGPAWWKLAADDFRCLGSMPITSVHWWGSYEGWDGLVPPRGRPAAWHIAFWSNVPASTDHRFSRPGKLLWQTRVRADKVDEQPVGRDRFPEKPSDTCFQYYVGLEPEQYFRQHRYVDPDSDDNIFWISITALYFGDDEPQMRWGWKTRPKVWMDAAVTLALGRRELTTGMVPDLASIQPVTNSLICERLDSYDMAFELDTDPDYIKWEQPFTGLRHWPHYEDEESMATEEPVIEPVTKYIQKPDLAKTGIDVDATAADIGQWRPQILADDFPCDTTGPLTEIRVWGSWYHDDVPGDDPAAVAFTLSIHADISAQQSPAGYSMPGEILWSRDFEPGEFEVGVYARDLDEGYYVPCEPHYEWPGDSICYRYKFNIDPGEAFVQKGSREQRKVYWLSVQARPKPVPGAPSGRFGWKTSQSHWNDDAVWTVGTGLPAERWKALTDPRTEESLDLAFAVSTKKETTETLDFRRLVADDWRCRAQTPVTAAVWWGSYIGYRYQACQCSQYLDPPVKPDYFLLSVWTDVPDPDPDDPDNYSHPGQKIWEHKAYDYDEVFVGYDKHPEVSPAIYPPIGQEPVFRYSVRLPKDKWFCQKDVDGVYWFSVVAVYEGPEDPPYPWGWTNHKCTPWEPPGLVEAAHFRFDEAGGITAHDSSGNGNHATLTGDPTWQNCCGIVCGSLDFDGDGDYVKTSDTTTGLDFAPGSFSVSAWINTREPTDGWRTILEYDRDGSDLNRFGMWLNKDGGFHFRVGRDTKNSNQILNAEKWYCLTATYDSADKTMRLYIDGQFDSSAVHSNGYKSANAAKLTIGVRGWEDAEYFNGLIDDVRIYDRVLSADEVKALADMGANDDAVAGHLDTTGATPEWVWDELHDQVGASADMSFVLFTEPGCFPCCHEDYFEWLKVGKPDCWCYPRQCHGDADGLSYGSPPKTGIYYVGAADLNILVGAWYVKEPPHGPGIASVPNGICVDFAHDEAGSPKAGVYRVGPTDLNILIANWFVKEPPQGPGVDPNCLDCP